MPTFDNGIFVQRLQSIFCLLITNYKLQIYIAPYVESESGANAVVRWQLQVSRGGCLSEFSYFSAPLRSVFPA